MDELEKLEAELASADDTAQPESQAPAPEGESKESKSRERNADGTFKAQDDDAPEGESEERTEADEPPADNGESEQSDEQDDQSTRERRRTARERIDQLTAQRNQERIARLEAERQRDELFRQLQTPVDPNQEFEDPTGFQRDQFERVLTEREARQAQLQADRAAQRELAAAQETFAARVDAVRDAMPDFDQVFSPNLPISHVAVEYLASSDKGPAIAYHLGKNPADAHRIASLPPVQQAIELARIEARVGMPKGRKPTSAPKPTPRVNGANAGASRVDPASASIDQIAKELGY